MSPGGCSRRWGKASACPDMSQSEWIVASVIAGFVLFLALKGKLGTYWSLLIGGGSGAKSSSPSGGASAATNPLGIAGGLAGGVFGDAASAATTAAQGAGGTVTGSVTQGGQTKQQGWSLLPGILPELPPVSF